MDQEEKSESSGNILPGGEQVLKDSSSGTTQIDSMIGRLVPKTSPAARHLTSRPNQKNKTIIL
jgi:hypothetical protein